MYAGENGKAVSGQFKSRSWTLTASWCGAGYVMDNRVGNTNKLGALFGILQAIGVFVPHPQPGTWGWSVGCVVDSVVSTIQ